MNKFLSFLIVMMATMFASNVLAFTPPPPPAQGGYVLDQTGRMSAADIQKLNQKIEQVNKATKNEFACVLLQDMGGASIEEVAGTTFRAWGVGKHGLDNGIMIIVALKEHKSRIETGKGVEGEVTDLQASDVLKNNLNPHLKRGDFVGGFDDALNALSSLLESRAAQKATPIPPVVETPVSTPIATDTNADGNVMVWVLSAIGLLGAGLLFSLWLASLARREDEEKARKARESFRLEQEKKLKIATPFTSVPVVPHRPKQTIIPPPKTTHHTTHLGRPSVPLMPPVVRDNSNLEAAILAAAAERREEEDRQARAREAKERREEEDRKRRDDDSSSSSSFDWGGGSSGSDSGGFGGFGGGDSGGGGSSSDW